MEIQSFDWKDSESAIHFLVKQTRRWNDVYLVDMGDDSYHFIVCDRPVSIRAIREFINKEYQLGLEESQLNHITLS